MNKRSSVALVAVLLAGCATEADVPQPTPASGLLGALAGVRATAESSVLVEYGDVAAVRALLGKDAERFRGLQGYGYSDLAGHARVLPDLVGFDPAEATTALRVGQSPKWAAVLRMDVDVPAVDAKLAGLGGRRADSGVWTTGEDNEIDPDGPLAEAGIVTGFQQVRVESGSVVHSPAGETLKWVTEPPGDQSLADDPMIGELARCLGDVSVALISKPKSGLPVAAGVRTTPAGESTEVVCVPDENPNALKDLVRTNLETTPWSEALAGATAEQPADQTGVVRVLAPSAPGARVGRVLQALQRGELPTLFD
ncbi:hypothetical protein ADK67_36535 [Saccharothrix sp. NRRL B-16348]|uniref:hypothetical protein n=1 Tax=Saccharothrix sp. NRRL B-16348 TaxID=1415542 RepID=UPI0006AF63F9|nr:hypothetical protein [Saccharothrix sp. NRRL B-16348]KOX18676.1 hypothetical protein ADK67_36535 [Saccharothrix sp. NRRL B-16348]